MQLPIFDALLSSKTILLSGAGGGFDIVSGIPLYFYLHRLGKKIVLSNLSFTKLDETESEEISPGTFHITLRSRESAYFPERLLVEWLTNHEHHPDMYAFSTELGVRPLHDAYEKIIKKHDIDTLILVDGGTDSLMFGDESGVGTVVEDACSIIAAAKTGIIRSFLVATGFGVEQFHNLNHYACLENIATLIKDGAYLGAVSLTKDMAEGRSYLDLVEFLNKKQPQSMSIVANSIASAIQGEFGDYHPTPRTQNSEQFINPLMGLFWFFTLQNVASRITFASRIENSETMSDAAKGFQLHRTMTERRTSRKIPL